MVRRAVDPMPLLLVCIVVFAACYFMVPDTDHDEPLTGNVEKDHDLGGHRQVKAWGCRKCYP